MTDYLEDKLVDDILRDGTTRYLALFSTATTDAGGGTEAVGGSYVRKAITLSAGAPTANTNTIVFTMPAGTWTHAAIHDHVSNAGATSMELHGPLAAPITTGAGDTITFAPGDVAFAPD